MNCCEDVAPLQRGFDLPMGKIIEGPYPVVFSNGIGVWNSDFKAKALELLLVAQVQSERWYMLNRTTGHIILLYGLLIF